jgi:hypothetical protein
MVSVPSLNETLFGDMPDPRHIVKAVSYPEERAVESERSGTVLGSQDPHAEAGTNFSAAPLMQ